jgi:hypothetical protein
VASKRRPIPAALAADNPDFAMKYLIAKECSPPPAGLLTPGIRAQRKEIARLMPQ